METIWDDYRHHSRAEYRERLIRHYLSMARRTIDRMPFKGNAAAGREDLLGHAVVGLMEAIDSYDPERGIRFEAYAAPRIRGAVIDALRRMDWVPRAYRRRHNDFRWVCQSLEHQLQRSPTPHEVCAQLNWSADDLQDHIDRYLQSFTVSLDEPMQKGEDSEDRRALLPDVNAENPLQRALQEEEKRRLYGAIQRLSQRERDVLREYYFENRTLKEIAATLGVTESRVCQIHTQALKRLRGMMEAPTALPA